MPVSDSSRVKIMEGFFCIINLNFIKASAEWHATISFQAHTRFKIYNAVESLNEWWSSSLTISPLAHFGFQKPECVGEIMRDEQASSQYHHCCVDLVACNANPVVVLCGPDLPYRTLISSRLEVHDA
jgi:hypothetical protein